MSTVQEEDTNDDDADTNSSNDYKEPSDLLKRLFLPSKPPSLTLSPNNKWLVYVTEPPLPTIDLLCQEEEKLAGIRFDPNLLVPSRTQWGLDLKIQNLISSKSK